MPDFKSSSARPGLVRSIVLAVVGLLVAGGVFFAGRQSVPKPKPVPPPPAGVRYIDGVPTGFPRTARGAGDTAAWDETLLAAIAAKPHDEVQALVTRLVEPQARATLVDQLMPSTSREGNDNISQTVVVRVWAQPTDLSGDLPVGTQVKVKTYGMGLFGARTDGQIAGPDTGLAGGLSVHDMTMQLDADGWHLRAVETPVPAPPPDLRGLTRDGSQRNTQILAEVFGPDSWVPNMP
jgi:hypothetical protein